MIHYVIDIINALFDSEITTYQIAKDTKQSTQYIDNYRKDRGRISRMSLEKARLFIEYYESISR